MARAFIILIYFGFLTGCVELPEIPTENTAMQSAEYPALMPIDQLLARGQVSTASEAEIETLRARAARLRTRAAVLRARAI